MNDGIDQLLREIENEWASDMDLILEMHPSHFPSDLLLEWAKRCESFERKQTQQSKILLALGVSGPLLLLAGLLIKFLGHSDIGVYLVVVAPVTFIACILGALVLSYRNRHEEHQDTIRRIIHNELQERGLVTSTLRTK